MGIRQLRLHTENVCLLVPRAHKTPKYNRSKLYHRSHGGRGVFLHQRPGRGGVPCEHCMLMTSHGEDLDVYNKDYNEGKV